VLVALWVVAATCGMIATLALLRAFVAPHLTTIEESAIGLGAREGSCLVR
jgi:hypothetical protein